MTVNELITHLEFLSHRGQGSLPVVLDGPDDDLETVTSIETVYNEDITPYQILLRGSDPS